jgi:Flp pilus assembly protein TadB
VADRRARRRELLAAQERDRYKRELQDVQSRVSREREERERQEARYAAEKDALERRLDAEKSEREAEREELHQRLDKLDQTRAEDREAYVRREAASRTRYRRLLLVVVGAAIALAGAAIILWTGLLSVGVVTVLAGILVPLASWAEVAEQRFSWSRVWLIVVVEAVAIVIDIL